MNHADATAPNASVAPTDRPRRGRWTAIAILVGVAALLLSVAAHRAPGLPGDVLITRSVQRVDARMLDLPLDALNTLGFPPLVDVVYGGIILAFFASGRRWEAAAGGFDVLGSAGLNALVKHLVDRPRPSPQLVEVEHSISNPSFPAGHVLNFTAFAGFLCCLAYLRMRPSWRRSTLIALLGAMIALMGVARVESGEHWPSDVLGGYLLGALWLAVTMRFYEWGRRRFPTAPRTTVPGVGHRGSFLALALVLLLPPALLAVAHAAPTDPDSLGASTGVPWNPPGPMARRLAWEQAVLLPGRIASLPFVGLGAMTDDLFLHLEQSPRFAGLLAPPGDVRGRTLAFKTPGMGDRTGLGGAVEVGADLLHGTLRSRVGVEYAATLHGYDRTQLTWSGRPLSLQYGYEWRPQDRFFGIGNETPREDVSDYASQSEFVRGGLTFESNRDRDPGRPRSVLRFWGGPRSQVTLTGRESGAASYEARFPTLAAAMPGQRVENLVYGASLLHDRRTGTPHWSRGWRTLLSAERFDVPIHALALRSGTGGGAQFTRYQAEVEAGFSFMRDPRSVRFLVRIADQQVSANRDRILVSDLSMLGGHAGLGGYSPGRFHDLDLLLTRLAYVFPLERRFELEVHSEWGAVYPDLWRDARLNTLHDSYGFSLRARDDRAPRASIGFDFSREETRLRFSLGGVE